MKAIFIACALLLCLSELNAQDYTPPTKAELRDYRKNPRWMEMMRDSSANYYDAIAAFNEFWKGKPNPIELMEHGEEGEVHEGEREEHEEHEGEEYENVSEKEREELIRYALEYKKFKFWQMQHQGFIHPDGTIMTDEEIQALVDQELQNRQNSIK